MPSFPSIDLSKFDLTKIDLPNVQMPSFDLPKVDLPTIDADRVRELARDVAYVGVGLTVLAVQRAQVARRDLTDAVGRVTSAVRAAA